MSALAPPQAVGKRTLGAAPSAGRHKLARREINLLINITLLGLVVLTFASGWAASLLGLTEFGLHKYSSIAMLVLAFSHIGLHWRSLAGQVRRQFAVAR
jgi:hypothetical protein